jgi:hypothetical protein
MTKAQEAAKAEAVERLKALGVKPGTRLHTVVRHVSASGMSRSIDVYLLTCDRGRPDRIWLSRLVATALGWPFDDKRDAVKVSGAGMDMGFHLVYELGHVMFGGAPWQCPGKGKCPSNAHSNPGPDRDKYGRGVKHTESGYALRQEWL